MLGTCVFLSALLGLAGCYPIKQTYFTPSAPTGITLPNYCHQQIGPRGTVNLKLHDMNLSVTMSLEPYYLVVTAYEINQDEVLFGPEPFVISSRQGSREIVPTTTYELEHTPRLYHSRLLQYEDGIRLHAGKRYQFIFKELMIAEDQFTFAIPPFVTRAGKIEIPIITFTKITEWRMDPVVLNC